jgi:general secretion pathway protein E
VSKRQIFKRGDTPCTHCQNTGYTGRTGIHELLVMNDEARSLVLQRVDSGTIKNAMLKHGFETLRVDGARKILEGVTSLEEVLMVTHEE